MLLASNTIADYMLSENGQVVCANILDQDGPVNIGVMTLDDTGNEEFGLTQEQWEIYLGFCAVEDVI